MLLPFLEMATNSQYYCGMKLGEWKERTKGEIKVGLSKHFCGFDLQTLQQQLGQLERSKSGKGKNAS